MFVVNIDQNYLQTNMGNREDKFLTKIGEPGILHDLVTLTQTGHVGAYYNTRMGYMRSLIRGQGVKVEEIAAYNSKTCWYYLLLYQMRYNVHILYTDQVVIHDAGWVEWHQTNNRRLGL